MVLRSEIVRPRLFSASLVVCGIRSMVCRRLGPYKRRLCSDHLSHSTKAFEQVQSTTWQTAIPKWWIKLYIIFISHTNRPQKMFVLVIFLCNIFRFYNWNIPLWIYKAFRAHGLLFFIRAYPCFLLLCCVHHGTRLFRFEIITINLIINPRMIMWRNWGFIIIITVIIIILTVKPCCSCGRNLLYKMVITLYI